MWAESFPAWGGTLSVAMQPDALAVATYGRGCSAGALSVVIADDDVLLRAGLASLLDRSGLTVLGQAGGGGAVAGARAPARPGCARRPDAAHAQHRRPRRGQGDPSRVADIAIVALSAQAETEHAMELGGQQAIVTYSKSASPTSPTSSTR